MPTLRPPVGGNEESKQKVALKEQCTGHGSAAFSTLRGSTMPQLATRFAKNAHILRSDSPLGEEQMRLAAPSIFAAGKHESRSERYAYIPTIDVLRGLQKEGFQPFMVAQGKSRTAGKAEFTKHLIRMRYQGDQTKGKPEANEIVLINSHDGASSYSMMAGTFRFLCCNGMVVGDICSDIRIKHQGNAQNEVIEGAFRVLDEFETVEESVDEMKAITLTVDEQRVFATAALALRYGDRSEGQAPAPITAEQLDSPRRMEDRGNSLWLSLQRTQENSTKGGLLGRSAQGRRLRTREVGSIDRSVSLNRALWVLAEEMKKLKG